MLHCIRYGLCVAPIFLLAGCWQKIEYKGKPASAANPSAPAPVVANSAADETSPALSEPSASPVDKVSSDQQALTPPPASEFQPVAATPIPTPPSSTPTPPSTKVEVDRYAMPPKAVDTGSSRYATAESAPPQSQPLASAPPSPARHTDASPVSATIDVPPPKPLQTAVPKTRTAIWTLGSRLSLAALANDRRMAANSIPTWLDEARVACKVLEVSVPGLPEPAAANDPAPASQQVIDYLLNEGQRLGREISKRFGPEQAALFEVALKSNFLLLLYSPGSNATNSLAAAISRAAPTAKLPNELWKPVIDRIHAKASPEDVQAAVRVMHADIARHLANSAEPTGR